MAQADPPRELKWGRTTLACLVVAAAAGAWGFGFSWTVAVLVGVAGTALWLAIGRDTEQSSAQLQVQRRDDLSLDYLRALVGVLDSPAFALDGEGRVLAFSPRGRELFPELAESRPLHQVSRNPELLAAAQRAAVRKEAQTIEMVEPAPRSRRLRVSVVALAGGGLDGARQGSTWAPLLLLQFRDMSEVDRLAQVRSEFIANASHELRTPLASIKGFIETLQGPASNDAPARTRFLSIMDGQAARMTRILDDLLSLSRLEMLAHVPPTDEVDVAAIVASVVEGLEPIARDAKITLQFNSTASATITRGDYDELAQVFQNLIQNAIKYGNEGGKVEITLRNEPSLRGKFPRIVIAVADDGPGIAAQHLPRLTERFYRVDNATSRERGGTGLGLAIVKHVLNRHRGELMVSSTLGKGSTFTVKLDALSHN